MNILGSIMYEAWRMLLESSVYILFGLVVSGLLRVFLNPSTVAKHLGRGRFRSVFKAGLLGIPVPLCSCGVLPAAVSLKKQGANTGATTAFLISTPESGVDSIAISYALLDPILTIARPVAAFFTAVAAGIMENLFQKEISGREASPDLSCPVDACCDGLDCPPDEHAHHHTFFAKLTAGMRYAGTEVWADIASWFFLGLLFAGLITAMIPGSIMTHYLGGGFSSMLLMLAVGIPLYICATASTPVAAALILKGVSPGAALVFLLAGPATNVTSLSVLIGTLGKRATAIYLGTITVFTLLFGLVLDKVYILSGVSAVAAVGQAREIIPLWMQWAGALLLLLISVKPLSRTVASWIRRARSGKEADSLTPCTGSTCDCSSGPDRPFQERKT
ncbi:MAG: SO_0444 family Cu/Zn efflux transporter [Deltaproteobacteria bacterium]|nr:SO_0444 family Cu/Zn efflux transporter [Deltaproteobacteria bacterium]